MARTRDRSLPPSARETRDAGQITLGRLLVFGGLVLLASLFFLATDLQHRIAGYRIVHGQGIIGTVTVTGCTSDLLGKVCHGDFTSADGTVRRTELTINGPSRQAGETRPTTHPAAISDPQASEAWTLTGSPWWQPSVVQIAALVPVALVAVSLWTLVAGGPIVWRAQARAVRALRSREREVAHRERVRRGHVH